MLKQFTKIVISTIAFASMQILASPVNLGKAGSYTLLSHGTTWNEMPLYGNLELGSEALINGNVGVRHTLNMAHGAVVVGNADFGSLTKNPGATINGAESIQSSNFWDALYNDVKSASQTAKAMTGVNAGYINSTQTFTRQGNVSVFNIIGLNLGSGKSLTLKGNENDVFIINVDYLGFTSSGGASIELDGVSYQNVLFNIHGMLNMGHVNVAAGKMQGTYIAPNGYFQLGDGLELNNVRFLGAGISGNLQFVCGAFPVDPVDPVDPS